MPNHIPLDTSKAGGADFNNLRLSLATFREQLARVRGWSKETYLNTGSADTDFAPFIALGVGTTNAEAHLAWTQVDTLFTKFTTNASVTSLMDTLDQLQNFLGGNR